MLVYVLGMSGHPLMPTSRCGHVRWLLKNEKAKVVKQKPFTIQLLYETPEKVQPLYGGTDPGRTNLGEAVLKEDGKVVYVDHVTTRNKEIPKLMRDRAAHRRASRQGERKRRQRRAIKNGTITDPVVVDRILPQCKEPIHNHYIKNTEARFCNRKRSPGWLTPTATQLLRTCLNMVDKICSILPVTDWTLEWNSFAFMQMEDGTVYGADFQNGRLKGYGDPQSYVWASQGGVCPICGKPIEHYHHIKPRHEGGADTPENLMGLCSDCHAKIHTRKIRLAINKLGKLKKYAALSILNQIIPYFYEGLVERFGEEHVHICSGQDTDTLRKKYGFPKEHYIDAMCIASVPLQCKPVLDKKQTPVYEVKQFRRHNRALINHQTERTYKLNGVVVAKNRKARFEQEGPSLEEFLAQYPPEQQRDLSQTGSNSIHSVLQRP